MRKLLTFRTESGDRLRVLWSNGECKTQAALEKVLAGGVSWEGIKTSGDTAPKPRMKFVSKKLDADNPEFLGLQNPPKAVKPVELDEEGKPKVKAKRVKKALTAEEVSKLKELAESMTVKQASEETGIPVHKLAKVAKDNDFAFVKGKRGKAAPAVDAAVLESVKVEAAKNVTLKEACVTLGIPYPKLYVLAKKNGITFKAGKKGFQKKAA